MSYFPQNAFLVSFGAYEDTRQAGQARGRYQKRDDVHPYLILDGNKDMKEALVGILESMDFKKASEFSRVEEPMTFMPDTSYGVRINLQKGGVSQFMNDLLSYLGDIKLIDRELASVQLALGKMQPVDPDTPALDVAEIAARAARQVQELSGFKAKQGKRGI
jgi:hypothetical protein